MPLLEVNDRAAYYNISGAIGDYASLTEGWAII